MVDLRTLAQRTRTSTTERTVRHTSPHRTSPANPAQFKARAHTIADFTEPIIEHKAHHIVLTPPNCTRNKVHAIRY